MRGIVGILVLMSGFYGSTGAQELSTEKIAGGIVTDGLQLILCAESCELKLGGPGLVRVGVRNCTPKAIELRDTGPVTTYIFEVRSDNGVEVPLSKDGAGLEEMRRNDSNFGLILEPGETSWAEVDLARWYELRSEGSFKVVATRSVQRSAEAAKATVRSNTLSLSIRQ